MSTVPMLSVATTVLLVGVSVAACRTTSNPREADPSDARIARDNAPREGGAASASAPPAASSSATAAPKNVTARPLGTGELGDIVSGAEAGPAYPKGTIVAVAFGGSDKDRAGLVEVDVGTGREVKRSGPLVSASSAIRLQREGDAIHLFTMQGTSIVWLSASRDLKESRRVTTKPSPGAAGEPRLVDAAVIGGRAFVVLDSNGVKVRVLDDRGATLATHDCRAHAPAAGASSILRRVGGLAVVTDLIDDQATPTLCGVRADGTGSALVRKAPEARFGVFVHDGIAYAQEVDIRRLDESLKPTGSAVADPRSCPDRPADCEPSQIAEHCKGLGGEGVSQMVRSGDAWVLRTIGCCGGPPGGVFVCEGVSVSAAPAH